MKKKAGFLLFLPNYCRRNFNIYYAQGGYFDNLSTKILIGLGLGIIAGLELGAEGVDFAKTWIGPFGTIFMI